MRIVSWNINGLRAVVSTQKSGGLQQLLHKLEADILCLQETKLTRAELTEKVSILPGWESFFDFCKTRTGYSGVATFCKDAFSPKAAERGITKNVMDDVMLDRLSEDEISALDAEGRCIATDHGAFVLFNVYMPALGCDDKFEARLAYKLQILRALNVRMQRLRNAGRHVIIVGDFNIAPTTKDHCDPGPDFWKLDVRPDRHLLAGLLAPPHKCGTPVRVPSDTKSCEICIERRRTVVKKLFGQLKPGELLSDAVAGEPGPVRGDKEVASGVGRQIAPDGSHVRITELELPCGGFEDTFRWFHRDREEAFTCWNTATGARTNNWGTRIDLILVANPCEPRPGWATCQHEPRSRAAPTASGPSTSTAVESSAQAWTWRDAVTGADIMPDFHGSDHAPVWLDLDLSRIAPLEGRPQGARPLPEASRSMFSGKQAQLSALWNGVSKGPRSAAQLERPKTSTQTGQASTDASASQSVGASPQRAEDKPPSAQKEGPQDTARLIGGQSEQVVAGSKRRPPSQPTSNGKLKMGRMTSLLRSTSTQQSSSAERSAEGVAEARHAATRTETGLSCVVDNEHTQGRAQANSVQAVETGSRNPSGLAWFQQTAAISGQKAESDTQQAVMGGSTCAALSSTAVVLPETRRAGPACNTNTDFAQQAAVAGTIEAGAGRSAATPCNGAASPAPVDTPRDSSEQELIATPLASSGLQQPAAASVHGALLRESCGCAPVEESRSAVAASGVHVGSSGCGHAWAAEQPSVGSFPDAVVLGASNESRAQCSMRPVNGGEIDTGAAANAAAATDCSRHSTSGGVLGTGVAMAASTTAVVEGSGQPVSRGVPDLRATETANAVTGVEDSRLPVSGGVSDTEAAVTANAVASVEDSRQQAAVRWREIQDKYAAVKCQGHDEPCVLRQVKKKGPNQGRLFYVCARHDGPPPHGRCDFFQWVRLGQRTMKDFR